MRGDASTYDVAIVGGGPSGSAAAIELARHRRRVLLLERSSRYGEVRVGETIPPQAAPLLRQLGVADAFACIPHLPAPGVVRLWETPAALSDPMTLNNDRHGWHVDRARFDALLADVAEKAGAVVCRGALAVSCHERSEDAWHLHFEADGRRTEVAAGWLIDATGRSGWLLRRQGVRQRVLDRLVGLLGYGAPRASGDHDLFVEATPEGWWYSAPLPGERSVAAFMTDSDLIPRDGRGMAAFWEEQRTRSELISCLHAPATELRSVVARTSWSGTVAAGRWLAVGDAAMAFDPLFGMGIFQALSSGLSSAHALLEAWACRTSPIGPYQAWSELRYREYLARRRRVYGSVTRWPDSAFWRRRAS